VIKKLIHITLTALVLMVFCASFMLLTGKDAHAATTQNTYHTMTTTAARDDNVLSIKIFNKCPPVVFYHYWWGNEWYLPSCEASLLAAGISVVPVVGTIGAAAVGASIAASCNGSIYVDQSSIGAGPAVPRPAC
jgi:hypothetical protein